MRAASSLRGWDENQEPLWHGAARCDGMFDAVLDINVRGKQTQSGEFAAHGNLREGEFACPGENARDADSACSRQRGARLRRLGPRNE